MNRSTVDSYLRDGCGRCEKYATPACKVRLWTAPLEALRSMVQATGLVEEMKWGSPCYTFNGKNVVMLVSLKDACALHFLTGAALDDNEGLLASPGPSSRYTRYLKFHSVDEVIAHRPYAERLLGQAIGLEKAGFVLNPPPAAEPVPEELQLRLETDPDLSAAWDALTPGRRRSHILFISGAKQTATRERRVVQAAPLIQAGHGQHER